jgi:hypothetical protein
MMTFLGSSNTFLSVLVTLIVLCILSNDSNFIHKILAEIKERINVQILRMKNESNFESITSTSQYKLLQYYIKGDNDIHSDLYQEALILDLVIKSQIDAYQGNVANKWMKPAQDTTNLISHSKEQIFSPLLALMIALVAFVTDEIVAATESLYMLNALATFMAVFLALSALLLLLLWLIFVHDVLSLKLEGEDV